MPGDSGLGCRCRIPTFFAQCFSRDNPVQTFFFCFLLIHGVGKPMPGNDQSTGVPAAPYQATSVTNHHTWSLCISLTYLQLFLYGTEWVVTSALLHAVSFLLHTSTATSKVVPARARPQKAGNSNVKKITTGSMALLPFCCVQIDHFTGTGQ